LAFILSRSTAFWADSGDSFRCCGKCLYNTYSKHRPMIGQHQTPSWFCKMVLLMLCAFTRVPWIYTLYLHVCTYRNDIVTKILCTQDGICQSDRYIYSPRTQGGPKLTGQSADQLPHTQGGYKTTNHRPIGLTSIKWYIIHTQQIKNGDGYFTLLR